MEAVSPQGRHPEDFGVDGGLIFEMLFMNEEEEARGL
jgi:hypothetical protein